MSDKRACKTDRKKMKVFLLIFLLSGLSLTSLFSVQTVQAKPDWLTGWSVGWDYRKSHLIEAASGAGIDYQIRIKVHYASGTDSGEDVFCNNRCRINFGDVRFTDDDGITELDYWLEKKVDRNFAVFWVKVADDLSISSHTIYIYYGQNNATTTSNGTNTFIRWDDFDLGYTVGDTPKSERGWTAWGSLNADNWVKITTDPNDSNNEVCQLEQASAVPVALNCDFPLTGGIEVHYRMKRAFDKTYYVSVLETGAYRVSSQLDWPTDKRQWYDGSRYWEYIPQSPSIGNNTWTSFTEKTTPTKYVMSIDSDNYTGGFRAPVVSGLDRLWIDNMRTQAGARLYIDDFFIRKYVDPEPSHGSWGKEETPFWTQEWFWTIVVAIIVLDIVLIVYFSVKKGSSTN